MVVAIILVTVGVSLWALSRRDIFYRLALSYYETVERRQLYRLLSHIFVHGGWMHLFINMYVFYSFGEVLYQRLLYFHETEVIYFPLVQFLFLYLGGGITAGLFSLLLQKNRRSLSIGLCRDLLRPMGAPLFVGTYCPPRDYPRGGIFSLLVVYGAPCRGQYRPQCTPFRRSLWACVSCGRHRPSSRKGVCAAFVELFLTTTVSVGCW